MHSKLLILRYQKNSFRNCRLRSKDANDKTIAEAFFNN